MAGDDAEDRLIPRTGFLRRYVDLWTPQGEAPATAHLAAALALVSAALGWRAWIQWSDSPEPCTLNVILEGASATARKTTVAQTAASIARRAMTGLDGNAGLIVRSMSHTSERGLLELIGTADHEVAKAWEERPPPGMLLDWDEFGSVLGRPGDVKGADWLGRVRATIMAIHRGRHGGIQLGSLKLVPSRCAVAILATMTRVELEQRASIGLMRDGFLGRFVLIPHPGRRAWLSTPPRWSTSMVAEREELSAWLRALAQEPEQMGHVFDRLTKPALTLRQSWYESRGASLEARAERSGADSDLAAIEAFGRLQTTALKVSAVVAVSKWGTLAPLHEVEIGPEDVQYGIGLAERAIDEVTALATDGHGVPADRYQRKALAYVAARGEVAKSRLLNDCEMDGMSRAQRWTVVRDMHPELVVIDVRQTKGRTAEIVRLSETLKPAA